MGTVDTDRIMKHLYSCLVSDFRLSFGTSYAARPLSAIYSSVKDFRTYQFPGRSTVSPALFKAEAQLESFFKRYRFKDDQFTDAELGATAYEKFFATQHRLDSITLDRPIVFMVLQEARRIAKDILGEYDLEEHYALSRFGKRACVGTPYSSSDLQTKLSRPLTGSLDHIRWFKNYLDTDKLLYRAICDVSGKKRPVYNMVTKLTMSLVPKSYKALRSIVPDTLLGSFYTNGLGRVITKRLRNIGLNIKRLQHRHGILAKRASMTREYVTADLSAASDSLTLGLLRRVLPLPWYRAVTHGRIPILDVNGTEIRPNTVLTMGLGHTFPLQTLVFYCLLKAIGNLKGTNAYVSVYGDDLIYSRRLHPMVSAIFPALGLILNEDKTYAEDFFRESCGSDYYRGCDVRPYSFEGEHQFLSGHDLSSFLYRIYNGLTRRWSPLEIPSTIRGIKDLLFAHVDRICYVPMSMPETSGIRVETVPVDLFLDEPAYVAGRFALSHPCLSETVGHKPCLSQLVYYWEAMRKASVPIEDEEDHMWIDFADSSSLFWHRRKLVKSGNSGHVGASKPHYELVPFVLDKTKRKKCIERYTSDCFLGSYPELLPVELRSLDRIKSIPSPEVALVRRPLRSWYRLRYRRTGDTEAN